MKRWMHKSRASRFDLMPEEPDGLDYRPQSRCPEQEQANFLLVAAIDFGTTYSGYAFAFTSETHNIRMNKNWGAGAFDSYKTPTSVLFGPTGFLDFGYEAERRYNDSDRKNYDLYRHFKMLLHNKNITKSVKIAATNGHKRAAVDVFAEALKYLKAHMIDAIDKTVVSDVDPNMIRWVITLPAIWSDEAKQFMREAALKAGCIKSRGSNQLVLALEPEAASIFCREIPVDPMASVNKATNQETSFSIGTQYLIIDAGGGTVDITAHEVCKDGNMKEILAPTGGPWGGTEVDKEFEKLLIQVMTPTVVQGLQNQCSQEWLSLMLGFESGKKRISTTDPESSIKLELNYNFCTKYQELSGKAIHQGFSSTKTDPVFFSNGKLVVSHAMCLQLFQPAISSTTNHVGKLFKKPEMKKILFVLLVGGFGECQILQSELKAILPSPVKLIVPEEAQLAIIKGAVQYGHRQNVVQSRYARKTYGIDIEPQFDKKRHALAKLEVKQGIAYCNDVFMKFIDKGTLVNFDDISCRTLYARTNDQKSMSFDIFCTDHEDLKAVEYTTDSKFLRVGGLTVFMPDTTGGLKREVEVQFKFGGTEIKVSAKDMTSGQIAETEVDMLLP